MILFDEFRRLSPAVRASWSPAAGMPVQKMRRLGWRSNEEPRRRQRFLGRIESLFFRRETNIAVSRRPHESLSPRVDGTENHCGSFTLPTTCRVNTCKVTAGSTGCCEVTQKNGIHDYATGFELIAKIGEGMRRLDVAEAPERLKHGSQSSAVRQVTRRLVFESLECGRLFPAGSKPCFHISCIITARIAAV